MGGGWRGGRSSSVRLCFCLVLGIGLAIAIALRKRHVKSAHANESNGVLFPQCNPAYPFRGH